MLILYIIRDLKDQAEDLAQMDQLELWVLVETVDCWDQLDQGEELVKTDTPEHQDPLVNQDYQDLQVAWVLILPTHRLALLRRDPCMVVITNRDTTEVRRTKSRAPRMAHLRFVQII